MFDITQLLPMLMQGMQGQAGQPGGLNALTSMVKGEDFWANAAPEDYLMMFAQMQQNAQPQGTPPPAPMRPTPSSFNPDMAASQMPEIFSPQRSSPFGLLNEDDPEKRLQALFGGLLT